MSKEITSSNNPVVKKLRALASSKKARQESGTFIVEGWRGIKTLLDHESREYRIEQIAVSDDWKAEGVLPSSIETLRMPAHVFDRISDVRTAQGILGVVRHLPCPVEIEPEAGRYLLLDQLRDPGNLGTLIRSAVGAGFNGILLYGDCVEAFNPKVIRSTMGTFAFLNIRQIELSGLKEMIAQGYEFCVTSGLDGENLYEAEFGKKTLLAIGSEAHGISNELMECANRKITIPLEKECESLNAAIAGSICMFQMRNAPKPS